MNKPNACIFTPYDNNVKSGKYRKYANKIDNLHDNTNNISDHSNNDKINKLDGNSCKVSYNNKEY